MIFRAIILLLIPCVCWSQAIEFSHDYEVFGIEEGVSDTFSIRLTTPPGSSATVTFSDDSGGMLSYDPASLTFTSGNYNSYQNVEITASSTAAIDAVRTVVITSTGGDDYTGTNRTDILYLRERPGDVVIWMIGDPHLGTDMARADPWNGVERAMNDFKNAADGGERLDWDIAICVGDITGFGFEKVSGEESTETTGSYAGQGIGRVWREAFDYYGTDINSVYTVTGNHDSGDTLQQIGQAGGLEFIDLYADPFTENSTTSGITTRPYPVTKHRSDIGSFNIGNVVFALIHDRNDAKFPAGRSTVSQGHPAGTYTLQAINIFDSLVNSNPQATVIGVAHHLLENTTTYTAFGEEEEVSNTAYGLHGNHSWMDQYRGSYAAIVWDESQDYDDNDAYRTTDGYNLAQEEITPFAAGFKETLIAANDHHLWLAGHTHPSTTAWDNYNGRQMAVWYDDSFGVVNCGALTRYHGPSPQQYSRIIHLYDGHRTARIQTYSHNEGAIDNSGDGLADTDQDGRVIIKGIADDLEYTFQLEVKFDEDYTLSDQHVRGRCVK